MLESVSADFGINTHSDLLSGISYIGKSAENIRGFLLAEFQVAGCPRFWPQAARNCGPAQVAGIICPATLGLGHPG